jgi:hypothetical protein
VFVNQTAACASQARAVLKCESVFTCRSLQPARIVVLTDISESKSPAYTASVALNRLAPVADHILIVPVPTVLKEITAGVGLGQKIEVWRTDAEPCPSLSVAEATATGPAPRTRRQCTAVLESLPKCA